MWLCDTMVRLGSYSNILHPKSTILSRVNSLLRQSQLCALRSNSSRGLRPYRKRAGNGFSHTEWCMRTILAGILADMPKVHQPGAGVPTSSTTFLDSLRDNSDVFIPPPVSPGHTHNSNEDWHCWHQEPLVCQIPSMSRFQSCTIRWREQCDR